MDFRFNSRRSNSIRSNSLDGRSYIPNKRSCKQTQLCLLEWCKSSFYHRTRVQCTTSDCLGRNMVKWCYQRDHSTTWRTLSLLIYDLAARRRTVSLWLNCARSFRWYILALDWSSRNCRMTTTISRFFTMRYYERSCLCSKSSPHKSSKVINWRRIYIDQW
jgi:hypothetical protein